MNATSTDIQSTVQGTDSPGHHRRVCIVATVPIVLHWFMAPHIRELGKLYDVTIVSNGTVSEVDALMGEHVRFIPIGIERKISLMKDLRTLLDLWKIFRRERFDCVHSLMPKAGLLGMLAAKFAGVPIRIHWFMGQVWATRSGSARLLLKSLDKLLAACATHLLAVSFSERDHLLAHQITRPNKLQVLAQGSVCGVDTTRFMPDPARRKATRLECSIPEGATVALYLGRLNRDKGMHELAAAYSLASSRCKDLHLLVVGPDEADMTGSMIRAVGDAADRLRFVGFASNPEAYMAAADYFVLPSHREGFGLTVIEAAACGIPSIGSRIYGLTDAIVDGQTGLLVPAGDVNALADAMTCLATDADVRRKLGAQALDRVTRDFQSKHLTDQLSRYYDNLLNTQCRSPNSCGIHRNEICADSEAP